MLLTGTYLPRSIHPALVDADWTCSFSFMTAIVQIYSNRRTSNLLKVGFRKAFGIGISISSTQNRDLDECLSMHGTHSMGRNSRREKSDRRGDEAPDTAEAGARGRDLVGPRGADGMKFHGLMVWAVGNWRAQRPTRYLEGRADGSLCRLTAMTTNGSIKSPPVFSQERHKKGWALRLPHTTGTNDTVGAGRVQLPDLVHSVSRLLGTSNVPLVRFILLSQQRSKGKIPSGVYGMSDNQPERSRRGFIS